MQPGPSLGAPEWPFRGWARAARCLWILCGTESQAQLMGRKRFSTVVIKVLASGLKAEWDLLWLGKLEGLPWQWFRHQRWRLCASNSRDVGSIPHQETEIPCAVVAQPLQKEKLESRLQRTERFLEVHPAQIQSPAEGRDLTLPLRTFEMNGELNPAKNCSKAQLHLSYRWIRLNSPHDLKGKEAFPLLGVSVV